MNETLTTHRFSRNGPVNREGSAALSRKDMGKDVTRFGSDWMIEHRLQVAEAQRARLLKVLHSRTLLLGPRKESPSVDCLCA